MLILAFWGKWCILFMKATKRESVVYGPPYKNWVVSSDRTK